MVTIGVGVAVGDGVGVAVGDGVGVAVGVVGWVTRMRVGDNVTVTIGLRVASPSIGTLLVRVALGY
jgi:hypothetical protein